MASPKFQWPNGKIAALSLSFDDARGSQAETGVPLFNKFGIKATFYVLPGNVEKDVAAWRAVLSAGHEIGNHSMTHPCSGNFQWSRWNSLEDYTLDRMEKELLDANAAIQQLLGVKPATYAYPCGHSFVGRGTELKSYIPLVAKHFIAGRQFITETCNDPSFCDLAHVCAFDSDGETFAACKALVEQARRDGGWVIFAGHEIGNGKGQVTNTRALESLCAYANDPASGIWVDTVAAIATHIRKTRNL